MENKRRLTLAGAIKGGLVVAFFAVRRGGDRPAPMEAEILVEAFQVLDVSTMNPA